MAASLSSYMAARWGTTGLFKTDREPPEQSVREGPAGDAGPSAYDAAAQSEQSI